LLLSKLLHQLLPGVGSRAKSLQRLLRLRQLSTQLLVFHALEVQLLSGDVRILMGALVDEGPKTWFRATQRGLAHRALRRQREVGQRVL
jgi:hypothetical protein